jgi:hypothetical protein
MPGDEALIYSWRLAGAAHPVDTPLDKMSAHERAAHLITNPADDDGFRHFALSLCGLRLERADFESALQRRYAAATVHERVLSDEPWLVWYVYRDGHWVGRSYREGE